MGKKDGAVCPILFPHHCVSPLIIKLWFSFSYFSLSPSLPHFCSYKKPETTKISPSLYFSELTFSPNLLLFAPPPPRGAHEIMPRGARCLWMMMSVGFWLLLLLVAFRDLLQLVQIRRVVLAVHVGQLVEARAPRVQVVKLLHLVVGS